MKKLNTYMLFKLATAVHPLLQIEDRPDQKYSDIWYPIWIAFRELKFQLSDNGILPASSKRSAQSLIDALSETINFDEFFGNPKAMEQQVTPWAAGNIKERVSQFEAVLASDLPGLDTYLVSQKGIYSTTDLVERAEKALLDSLPEDCRKFITSGEIRDFQQAGRCLALEMPTASGFHAMRAMEAIVRRYWREVTNAPEEKSAPVLAQCIKELTEKKEDPKVLNILDHARDLIRNPLMHPDAFLEMDEAYRTFDIAKSAICAVAMRLKQLSPQLELQPISQLQSLAELFRNPPR